MVVVVVVMLLMAVALLVAWQRMRRAAADPLCRLDGRRFDSDSCSTFSSLPFCSAMPASAAEDSVRSGRGGDKRRSAGLV